MKGNIVLPVNQATMCRIVEYYLSKKAFFTDQNFKVRKVSAKNDAYSTTFEIDIEEIESGSQDSPAP